MFPQAFDDDHLAELVDANSSVPDWVDDPEVLQRIIEHAKGRAAGRGEESALDSTEAECLITTDWNSFTDDWGFDDGNANQVALGVFNEEVSSGKQADLFNETVIVQTGWLRTGDGARARVRRIWTRATTTPTRARCGFRTAHRTTSLSSNSRTNSYTARSRSLMRCDSTR